MPRTETVARGNQRPDEVPAEGVERRIFASGRTGARGLSTGTLVLAPGAAMPGQVRAVGGVYTVLEGEATVVAAGRAYGLGRYDAIHVPGGTVHEIANRGPGVARLHWAIAGEEPEAGMSGGGGGATEGEVRLVRFDEAPVYSLAEGTAFRDLFARRLGSRGICGGYGLFAPGTGLPCHVHDYDESITIVEGEAICLVAGREYRLSGCDTACIPRGRPHRFLNRSDRPMAMVWVYAGDEPDRVLVDAGYCDGSIPFLGEDELIL